MTKEIIVKNIPDYLSEILNLVNEWDLGHGDIWFRGVCSEKMNLLPGVKWRNIDIGNEESLISSFLIHSKSLSEDNTQCPWQLYSLMQHYGLPTRLLDWSKSPLVAAYFALEADNEEDRIVWVMDPFSLNELSTDYRGVFVPYIDLNEEVNIDCYLPRILRKDNNVNMQAFPIAIEPPYTNKRILAQQGCFTVHGSKDESIDVQFDRHSCDKITKIKFCKDSIGELRKDLNSLGVTVSSIYQDLNSLSKQLVEHHKFT
ncbi:FRG domain-containing protein [Aliivibrio fischeri]|uniref:FRG domain-containing protein n=1 Tax=Aliivibrio fischeri TaxID=668 RepID=A0A6N3YXK7_ALIFS|nr:FRG domain-containing protein [Aliivibrio fischeri]MUK45208.1 FRG domain-containing protein [Aliivibrio fischeri]MUK80867.1 FRG domain-containing protein [Aliivibrio fischeri]MUK82990.1 FRG domain-containing protein [Aliivibrio fischeri]